MNACVVDASVAIKWYIPEIHFDEARRLLVRRRDGELTIHVPDLFLAEIGNILWKKVRRAELERDTAWAVATEVLAVPSSVYMSGPLLPAALELALAADRSVYDSLYLSLASALGCPLVTADARLHNALASTPFRRLVRWIEDV